MCMILVFSWCNAIAFSRFLALFQMWDFLKGGCLFCIYFFSRKGHTDFKGFDTENTETTFTSLN